MHASTFVAIAACAAVLALWFGLFGLVLLATRARPVPDAVPSQEFGGDEPPAVVSLLSNGWEITEDAAESTLLDLAARGYVELRQPGDDPMRTTVHVRAAAHGTDGLTPYERMVLDRITATARGGVVPVTALTFRDEGQAKAFAGRLRGAVVEHARALGLSQRRISPALLTLLGAAAVLPAGAVAATIFWSEYHGKQDYGGVIGAAIVTFGGLTTLAGRNWGERDTDAGLAAAARWAGLRAWLRRDEAFQALPPASVAVWQRYLSYGDALGGARVCAAVLDLGMGDRRRVWSHFGGSWHRVRVRYPRFWPRYGAGLPRLLRNMLLAGVAGCLMLVLGQTLVTAAGDAARVEGGLPTYRAVAVTGWLAVGALLLGYALYALVRILLDVSAPVELTGEVLWAQLWRSTGQGDNARPYTYHLAVDDGSGERTTAWALPADLHGRCVPGDVVRLRVRRWSRRITEVTVVERGAVAVAGPPRAT